MIPRDNLFETSRTNFLVVTVRTKLPALASLTFFCHVVFLTPLFERGRVFRLKSVLILSAKVMVEYVSRKKKFKLRKGMQMSTLYRQELEVNVARTRAEFKVASDNTFEVGTNPYATPTEVLVACKAEDEKRFLWQGACEALRLSSLADRPE